MLFVVFLFLSPPPPPAPTEKHPKNAINPIKENCQKIGAVFVAVAGFCEKQSASTRPFLMRFLQRVVLLGSYRRETPENKKKDVVIFFGKSFRHGLFVNIFLWCFLTPITE
jgi:hypothetical protein